MKICDVVTDSVWYDPRVRKQIDAYVASGCEVYTVGIEDDRMNPDEIKKIPGNVTLVSRQDLGEGKLSSPLQTIKRMRKCDRRLRDAIIASGADIIHANDLNGLVPAAMAAKKMKCPIIYDSHEIFIENQGISCSRVKKRYWSRQEKKLMKKVALLVSVSHAAAEYLKDKYHIKKTMVVTNCCQKTMLTDFPEKNPSFELVNHGRFYRGRGYETMLQAAKLTRNPEITYVLRGLGQLETELRAYMEKNQLKNARMDPPVKVYELIPAAAKSRVGVAITEPTCLNFRLSVSNKLFEYAAAGLPVILSDIPEHRYLNDKYHFGIILEDTSPECLAKAAETLYNDKALYEECRKNAERLSNEVNWENEFARLIAFERELIGEETPKPAAAP